MGGLLTSHQCSRRMESLKDHSFWDLGRTWVRKHYFWFILVTIIVLALWIISYSGAPPEPGRTCPKDQANLLHSISQLEGEKVTLRKQLIKMEKEMQTLRNFMNRTQEKTLQLLEKKEEEADALNKESSGFNQSLVLTRQLLEKEKEKSQSLQTQLEIAKKDLREIQEQRDSWQKQLNTLEEKLKSPDSKAEEYKNKIADLQRQLEQKRRIQDSLTRERAAYMDRIWWLNDQITQQKQQKCSIENILNNGTIVFWAFVILLLLCCVACCSKCSSTAIQEVLR